MKENDIRPQDLFSKYLNLAKEDCKTFFNNLEVIDFNCPIHQSESGQFLFTKNNFEYRECPKCLSIFSSPRHKYEYYKNFYNNGKSVKFWSKEFYKKTEDVRRKNLWEPKVKDMIKNKIINKSFKEYSIVDIGGGYGVFAETIMKEYPKSTTVIEPNCNLASICKRKGINVIEKVFHEITKNDLPKGSKIFTSFELLEHLHDPREFLLGLKKLMQKGDILYLTTLTSSGLDIKELMQHSNAITPPQHINFISVSGMEEFLRLEGFEEFEITTPGKLDLDILKKNKEYLKEGLLLDILNTFSEDNLNDFQRLLSKNKMSSHMLITARL